MQYPAPRVRATHVFTLAARRIAAGLALASAVVTAQGPRGADSLSPAAVAESLATLDRLRATLDGTAASAAAWYRTGMIAWALSDRGRASPPIAGLDWTRLGRMADTSLRMAAQLAPDNGQYRMMVGRYLLASGVSITRAASYNFFDDALAAARRDTNGALHAEAAIEAGRVRWRRYDALVNRRVETAPGAAVRSIMNATARLAGEGEMGGSTPLKSVVSALEMNSMPLPPEYSGLTDYEAAEQLFREAYGADPVSPRAFHHVAMVLAERNRWGDLEEFVRTRLRERGWDGTAWLVLGLATHRLGKPREAALAFDSAMVYLAAGERARLDRIERILRRADTGVVRRGGVPERMATRRIYWLFADPLWSREGNESRVEFLARVTFAELRWTVDELNVRGADTDRGDVFVRYGPPNLVASFSGDPGLGIAEISTVWVYNTGFVFTFAGAPTFATARIPVADEAYVAEVRELQPVRWDNLATFRIDSMPSRAARFRGTADSVDVMIAAEPPVDSIRASGTLGATPRADLWLLAGGTVGVHHDTTALTTPGVVVWTKRLKHGAYVYRAEASVDAGTIGARATAPVIADHDAAHGFTVRGTGISDVVIATEAEPRRGVTAVGRWTDVSMRPATGALPFGGTLALVWENYEFGVRDGNAEYTVTIIVHRERSAAGRLATQIVGRLGSVVGVDRTEDRVSMRFDRTVRHAAAFADLVSVALHDTPAGNYTVTLEITDKVTGRTFTRGTSVAIAR